MAAQVMRQPFEQVRFNYLVNWYPKGAARYSSWNKGEEPDITRIVGLFANIMGLHAGDALARSFINERMQQYSDRIRVAVSEATHPYDKVGAILTVFKQCRSDVLLISPRKIQTEHLLLRSTLNNLLHGYSMSSLRCESGAIAPFGTTRLLRSLHDQPAVRAYLAGPEYIEGRTPSMRALLDDGGPCMHPWTGFQDAYMERSVAVGQALRSLPACALYLVDGKRFSGFRALKEKPRRPDFWFTLSHYLAAKTDKTWNRQFVADALLRNVHAMKEPDREDDGSFVGFGNGSRALEEAEKKPLPTYTAKLRPILNDGEYNAHWLAAESAAWRDYRRLRLLLLEEDTTGTLQSLKVPCDSDRIHAFRHKPEVVFEHTWPSPLSQPRSAKLLDVAVPGLGARYQMIMDLEANLSINHNTKKTMLRDALSEIQHSSALDEMSLPSDLSL
jgi:hypothetical protein